MEKQNFVYNANQCVDAPDLIISPSAETEQELQKLSALTNVIEALEAFQDFDNVVKTAAIALRASEMGLTQLHFYAIALHAGLEGKG